MRVQAWRLCLAVAAMVLAAFMVLPTAGWVRVGAQVAIGYVAVGAILAGARRSGARGRAAWYWFAFGVFGNATGILVEQVDIQLLHGEGFPSVADPCYLSLYPAVAVGLVILIRRRTTNRERGTLVDATTVTTGLGLLAWVFMIHPAVSDDTLSVLGHAVSVSYPIGDVVLAAMLVRLVFGGGTRTMSYSLIAASLLAFLTGDTVWAVVNQVGWEPSGYAERLLQGIALAAYLLFALAALHPTARDVGQRSEPTPPLLRRPMLAALTAASMIAPAVLAIQVLRGRITDGLAIALGCFALFGLVVARMAQLLRDLEDQATKVRELSRTDELTGLPNRRAWMSELPRALERARRAHVPLTIAMIDLDHFKGFNDAYGHPAGDRLLKAAAAAWSGQVRTIDHFARYGGEEFILLLPDTDTPESVRLLGRLQGATPLGQTFSAGVATWNGDETSDEFIARADAALYEAKRAGRDRVVAAGTPAPELS